MKTLIYLSLISFNALASVTPKIESSIDDRKTIHVVITNETDNPIHCRWSISWFDTVLSFNRYNGYLDVFPTSSEKLEFVNDPFSKVYKLKTHFECL
jgi:hypothetical protein